MDLPESDGMLPTESEQSRNLTPVTIPYFLYEAMARSYYGSSANADRPRAVWHDVESSTLDDVHLSLDVPSNWIPGGFAAQEQEPRTKKQDHEGPSQTT